MIAITGAAGFIGSYILGYFNQLGYQNIVIVDDFSSINKSNNIKNKHFVLKVERSEFLNWIKKNPYEIKQMIHLGARTDTTSNDIKVFETLNLNFSKSIWTYCAEMQIPLIYASSAATYGLGELGYADSHELPIQLKPLNAYGISKNDFDIWALQQTKRPPFWAGLKFFNVYGPNEYHKGRMASVIYHAFCQINDSGKIKLFRSHRSDYKDGMQLRDFIYVRDIAKIIDFMMESKPHSGIYNAGTGKAETFISLAESVFLAMQLPINIDFIDTPEDIRNKYQYYTQSDTQKLISAGFDSNFTSLKEGIFDYVFHFLKCSKYF